MKLIDKDAIVAEIDDWRDMIKKYILTIPLSGRERADATLEYGILGKVRDFLDIFKVKEFDLMKEVDLIKEYDDFQDLTLSRLVNRNAGIVIAKHFFELGLKAQK